MYKKSISILSLLLAACSSTAPQVKTENVSLPKLNYETSVFLGDRLLMQATGFHADSLVLGNADGVQTRISSGKYCQRQINSDTFYSTNNKAVGLKNGYGVVLSHQNYITYKESKNEVCASPFSCYDQDEISITYKKNDLCIAENTSQQLIEYNGKSGNILNFTYREFSEGYARSPFTTNFTMDLSEGDIIGYKGARIKVKKATNNKITYSVIQNFNTL